MEMEMIRNNVESKRVKELEDIICTLKFELNGLKSVVATVENEARTERETLKQDVQQRVQDVVEWVERMKGEVENKATQITQLEEKIKTLETKIRPAVPFTTQEIPIAKHDTQNIIEKNALQPCTCHAATELQTQRDRIQALENQLQLEILCREKWERDYAELLEKYKEVKPKKEKKPPANLGVPHKLILPEAPAPKFWLQTIQPSGNTEVLSLNDLLDGILRPFREDEIWALLYQVCSLLKELHDGGKIHGNLSLDTIGSNYDGKLSFIEVDEEAAPKFKPGNHVGMDSIYDIFGLGVVMWSTSDYLLEDDEEPATSEALCILIGDMTSDVITEIPAVEDLIARASDYKDSAQNLFREMMREYERKKEMRIQYEKGITQNQGHLVKSLLTEIAVGISLKKLPPSAVKPRPMTPDNISWQTNNAKMKLIRVA